MDRRHRGQYSQRSFAQRDAVDTAGMVATIVVLCAMASALYGLIHLVERRSRVVDSLRGRSA